MNANPECTGDDSCQVPEHWPDKAFSGPHRGKHASRPNAPDPYQPALTPGKCPRCGAPPTVHQHYPSQFGEPVDRYYCDPCDAEWWSDDDEQ